MQNTLYFYVYSFLHISAIYLLVLVTNLLVLLTGACVASGPVSAPLSLTELQHSTSLVKLNTTAIMETNKRFERVLVAMLHINTVAHPGK